MTLLPAVLLAFVIVVLASFFSAFIWQRKRNASDDSGVKQRRLEADLPEARLLSNTNFCWEVDADLSYLDDRSQDAYQPSCALEARSPGY